MKRIILINGIIAGFIVSFLMLINIAMSGDMNMNMENSMMLGYATMLLAFTLIFVAIKQFRDKHNQGVISFGKAFKIGFFISLIASTMYVISWLIDYYGFNPDYIDVYIQKSLEKMKSEGMNAAELSKQATEMKEFGDLYKNNPLVCAGMTYVEILPVGLIVSLICALILKRKPKTA